MTPDDARVTAANAAAHAASEASRHGWLPLGERYAIADAVLAALTDLGWRP